MRKKIDYIVALISIISSVIVILVTFIYNWKRFKAEEKIFDKRFNFEQQMIMVKLMLSNEKMVEYVIKNTIIDKRMEDPEWQRLFNEYCSKFPEYYEENKRTK